MTRDELECLLKAWGRAYGEGAAREWDEGTSDAVMPGAGGMHPIAAAMEFAPGRRGVIRARTHMDRGGYGRRSMMAAAAGVKGLSVVPAAFVDPIRATSSRSGPRQARPVPPEIQLVQRAALDLHALDPVRGICLRVHYCTRASLEERASDARSRVQRFRRGLTLRSYRDEVAHARTWVHARLAPLDVTSDGA